MYDPPYVSIEGLVPDYQRIYSPTGVFEVHWSRRRPKFCSNYRIRLSYELKNYVDPGLLYWQK